MDVTTNGGDFISNTEFKMSPKNNTDMDAK